MIVRTVFLRAPLRLSVFAVKTSGFTPENQEVIRFSADTFTAEAQRIAEEYKNIV